MAGSDGPHAAAGSDGPHAAAGSDGPHAAAGSDGPHAAAGSDGPAPARAGRTARRPLGGAAGRRLAVERVRQAILAGDMAPGQRLVEDELAGMLAVTRASVRAALIDLAAGGLVERVPNRGARVRVISAAEAVAITECRMALEGLCAAKAAQNLDDAQAARLAGLGEAMRAAVAAGEPVKYSALNSELHRLIRELSGQRVAAALIEQLNAQLVRHQFRLSLRPGRPQVSLAEHLAIIDAITARQPAAAEQAIRRHLASVITALLDQREPGDPAASAAGPAP